MVQNGLVQLWQGQFHRRSQLNLKNWFSCQQGLIPCHRELLTKVFKDDEPPVEAMEALNCAGLEKPGLEQNKKLNLMTVKIIKIIFTECFLSEPENEASKRPPPCPKDLGKGIHKLGSEEVSENM